MRRPLDDAPDSHVIDALPSRSDADVLSEIEDVLLAANTAGSEGRFVDAFHHVERAYLLFEELDDFATAQELRKQECGGLFEMIARDLENVGEHLLCIRI